MIIRLRGSSRPDAGRLRARRERRRLSPSGDTSAVRAAERGGEVVVETYLHVREDALQLYAFAEASERQLFLHLLTVAGIGPKVALAIVSGSPAADLRRAIVLQDTARFQAIPGVGKKTAERIVLELKEKLGAEDPVPISSAAGTSVHLTARDVPSSSAGPCSRPSRRWRRSIPTSRREERVRLALRQVAEMSAVAGRRVHRAGRGGARAHATPAPPGRVRRPGRRQGTARDRARPPRRRAARRSTTSCSSAHRASASDPGADHPRGARRRHPHDRRPGAREEGRHGGDPDRA